MRPLVMIACASFLHVMPFVSEAQLAPTWTVGGEEAVETELGARARVFSLPNHLLVIERDAPFLKLVTRDGRVRQQVGRLGGGPGEFRQPSAALYDAERKEVLVVDGAAVRVSVYSLGDSLRFVRSLVAPEPGLEGVCKLGGRWFGMVRNTPTMLREFSVDGDRLTVKRSFATPRTLHPLSAVPALRNEASGSLGCDQRAGDLIVISRTLGEVHRIDVEGQRHIVTALPGFRVMPMVANGGGFAAEIRQGDVFDVVSNVTSFANEVVAIVARGTQTPQGRRIDGYLSYSLAARTAEGPSVETWGRVGEFDGHVVCLREEPIPTLAMFASRRCPSR